MHTHIHFTQYINRKDIPFIQNRFSYIIQSILIIDVVPYRNYTQPVESVTCTGTSA